MTAQQELDNLRRLIAENRAQRKKLYIAQCDARYRGDVLDENHRHLQSSVKTLELRVLKEETNEPATVPPLPTA